LLSTLAADNFASVVLEYAMSAISTLYRVTPDVLEPMKAEKSALGTVPAAAHQYCEPLRAASSLGWYVFPPSNIRLRFDGHAIFIESEGQWQQLSAVVLPQFLEQWRLHAPKHLKKFEMPHVSAPFMPGMVQIWSGFLISTQPGWGTLVRGLVNQAPGSSYSCFEGFIETDVFKPCPLFINLRLHVIDTVIELPKLKPLFQYQVLPKEVASEAASRYDMREGLSEGHAEQRGMLPEDWEGLATTIRSFPPTSSTVVGKYGAMIRKHQKNGPE
jgi:hypothetical protein